MEDNSPKQKYKHQLILKGSTLDIGMGCGVLVEKELFLSEEALRLIKQNHPSIMFTRIECDTMFISENIEVRMVKCDGKLV